MENNDSGKKEIEELMATFKAVQERLLQEVVNSHTQTEMTLKQLVAYLNISTQNLTELRNIINNFNTNIEILRNQVNNDSSKIIDINKKIDSYPNEVDKLKSTMKENYDNQYKAVYKCMFQLNEALKKLYTSVGDQNNRTQNLESSLSNIIKVIENNLDKNNENLTEIINTLINSNTDVNTKAIDAKTSTSVHNVKKYEIKLKFWMKVISIVFASGGVIYTIIDLIIKYSGSR